MSTLELGIAMFNVRDFGAKGDGAHMDTQAIQSAIDACAQNGGGTVVFPAGNYLTGTIFMKSNVKLYLAAEATLLGSRKLIDYATNTDCCRYKDETEKDKCLIYAGNAKNIGLIGQGTINGQGQGTLEATSPRDRKDQRPMLIRFVNCENVSFAGLTLKNAFSWCSNFISCENIRIEAIKIYNRINANNDGFDLDSCQNVFISNCRLSCGDDAIALQTSEKKPCKNIVITNCVLSSQWAAIRFGPLSCANFEDITVSNCVIHDTYGCAIKLQMCEGARIENILFSNLIMKNVTGPISLSLSTCSVRRDYQCKEPRPIKSFRNVLFSNIRAEVAKGPQPPRRWPGEQRSCISIIGSPGHNITGITLSNIHITYPGGGTSEEAARRRIPELREVVGKPFPRYPEYFSLGILPAYGLYVRHGQALVLSNVRFDLASPDRRPALVCDDVEDLEICGLRAEGNPDSECLIRLQQVRWAFIHGCRPLSDIKTFLRVEGRKSQQIALIANDLRRAKSAVEIAKDVERKAVITSADSTRY